MTCPRRITPIILSALAVIALAACGSSSTKTVTTHVPASNGLPPAVRSTDANGQERYTMTFPAGTVVTSGLCKSKAAQIRQQLVKAGLPAASATVVEFDGGDNAPGTITLCGSFPQ